MSSVVRVFREPLAAPDAYDGHLAVITVDGAEAGLLQLGETADYPVDPGTHEIGVRLQHNSGTAQVTVEVAAEETVSVSCAKAHSARTQVIHPSHYWRLTVAAD